MVIDHCGHKATHSRRFYPVLFWGLGSLLILVLMATSFLAGSYYKPFWKQQDLRPQYLQLQRLYQELRSTLNDTTTQLGLRDEQINMLQEEIKAQTQKQEALRERLHVYDTLLAARKSTGMQLLQFQVHALEDHQFDVDLTLVHGEDKKRYANGWIKLFMEDMKGKKHPLLLSTGKYKWPYRIESHGFLHETARWLQSGQPGRVMYVHVYASNGKVLLRQQFTLGKKGIDDHVEKKQQAGSSGGTQPRQSAH